MFNTNIQVYSIMIIIAILCNVIYVFIKSNKYFHDFYLTISLVLYEIVGIILGGKIYTYIANYDKYHGKFNFLNLGMSSLGSVFGALIFIIIFCLLFKVKIKKILNIIIIPIPLMYSIGKIGCFLVGCCYGIKYSGFGSIVYHYSHSAPNGISLFPVQVVESIVFFIIFIYFANNKKLKDLKLCGSLFITCGICKFLLDFLRNGHDKLIISFNQYGCLLFIIIGLIMLIVPKYLHKKLV